MTPAPAFASRAEFQAALLWGFEAALASGARKLWCVDRDFADWPLDDPALLDSLGGWLKLPQRRLLLLAAHYEDMGLRHPRFVAWRRNWVHAIDTLSPSESGLELPSLLVDDGAVCVQLVDAVHWRGQARLDVPAVIPFRQAIDALIQRSAPAFPASHLGL